MVNGISQIRANALKCLKKDFQSALVITFITEFFTSILMLLMAKTFNENFLYSLLDNKIPSIDNNTLLAMGVLLLCVVLISPILKLGAIRYFTLRYKGESPAFNTLFSFVKKYFKVLALYILIFLLIVLWSLIPFALYYLSIRFLPIKTAMVFGYLLVIPIYYAMIRYFNAPYIYANEDIGIISAIRKSAKIVKNRTIMQASMILFFMLIEILASMLLSVFSGVAVLSIVLSQIVALLVKTWYYASTAGFYLHLSNNEQITDSSLQEHNGVSDKNNNDLDDKDLKQED